MEWKDVGLTITDSPVGEDAGVLVEQTMDGIRGTNCYRARFWSFKNYGDSIKKFVDACLKRKMVFAIQENHPLEGKRGQNKEGVRYISFGRRGKQPGWDCCIQLSYANGALAFKVRRDHKELLKAAGINFIQESGAGRNLTVNFNILDHALDAVIAEPIHPMTNTEEKQLPPTLINTIYFGPPGTGKTYQTAERAVEICDGEVDDDRKDVMDRYQELCEAGRIAFLTFHQSFAYEEFIEGLRPEAGPGGIQYLVRPGALRKIASAAMGDVKADSPKENNNGFDNLYSLLLEEVRKSGTEGLEMTTKTGKPFQLRLNGTVLTAYPPRSKAPIYRPHLCAKWAKENSIKSPGDCDDYGSKGNKSYYFSVIEKLRALRTSSPKKIDNPEIEQSSTDDDDPTEQNYVLIIDEINRANISKVFGELITLLEADKRLGAENELTVTLPYSGEKFGLPPNLYIIGTMNTADRSIALLDIALRRRFNFVEMEPQPELLLPNNVPGVDLKELLKAINLRIEFLLDRDHRIGHAYFMGIKSIEDLNDVFMNRIIPLLQEYFYEDWQRILQVLATGESGGKASSTFITEILTPKIPGVDSDRLGNRYRVNAEKAFTGTDYQRIYNTESNNASAAE